MGLDATALLQGAFGRARGPVASGACRWSSSSRPPPPANATGTTSFAWDRLLSYATASDVPGCAAAARHHRAPPTPLMPDLATLCARWPWRSCCRLVGGSLRAGARPRGFAAALPFSAPAHPQSQPRAARRPRTTWSCRRGGDGALSHELLITHPRGAGLALVVRAARHP
jgi:hypothetical protein